MGNSFGTEGTLSVGNDKYKFHKLAGLPGGERLPFSLKVLLENLLRHEDDRSVRRDDVEALLKWDPKAEPDREIAFRPARVLLQDFTGVPVIVDLAAMRDAITRLGGNPERINPLVPLDLVIDHSVQVDSFASEKSYGLNVMLEYERNKERYGLLRWGQQAFRRFRVVPPGMGICHQVNLEYLAQVVFRGDGNMVYPDTLVGTDSHTTMVNSLGVLGWGVGGIEAEAAMLGQPVSMLIPQVVGFKLHGQLREGATATDVVLTATQMLRKKGVVGKFVEYYGPGIAALALPDRATIANMAPEYGATMGFFPVDQVTLEYLSFSGRDKAQVALVEAYCKENGLFHSAASPEPSFSDTLELDLGTVEPSLAGPKRPQDRVALSKVKAVASKTVDEMCEKGPDLEARKHKTVDVELDGNKFAVGHSAVVIAAITSCTNTSNPAVMLGAGLVARNAVAKGLTKSKPWVKTSLAPGSRVVTEYLKETGLLAPLETLGFNLVGYGCTTCIGNSGPLPEPIAEAVTSGDLVVAAVLSGNRNFEGRINALVRMNFLASPMLVVAYALAGTVDIDLHSEPLGTGKDGKPVYLRDIWPTNEQIREAVRAGVKPEQYTREYGKVFDGDESWKRLSVPKGQTFAWEGDSTYVRNPPFFEVEKALPPVADIVGARCLALLGDSVTTDHISPAGSISKKSPAAAYLIEHGVKPEDFNSYGARRGNHEVMMRGTFANIRLRNLMLPGVEGGMSKFLGKSDSDGPQQSIYDAAMKYKEAGVPLVVVAGAEYGTGSSRDWAAKGTLLLGVRAVIAKSFERIHRSNLVGMGVLPLQFMDGEDATTLGLTGYETFDIAGVAANLAPGRTLEVRVGGGAGGGKSFKVRLRIDTPNEVDYYKHGGILPYVLRQLIA
ncbi:MAG TPA: aconitate hydratase AcnA [Polyangia bacterium]|nr:aconitate hydratase AcnA [Polyangia bacterium]